MEQSDQKSVIESGGAAVPPPEQPSANAGSAPAEDSKPKHDRSQKRKRGGGQSGQKNDRGRSDKGGDMGRREYFRNNPDKRHRNDMNNAKRQKREEEGAPEPSYFNFSKEEIEAEERKPKRKVAILVGYSGTGYKGMQISPTEKTIEGDLFMAFIKAGAISKANANDPKKSGLVRCARTDKGVHAAGNVINLKLIIEDPDIKQKINDQLSSQIRIWQIQRTTGSFSCYQACDSRWYEYLIPSHSFLPPHPSTFLSKKLIEHATEVGDLEEHQKRQHEVAGWWEAAEEKYIKPILDGLDEIIKPHVMQAMYISDGFPTQDDRETEVTTDGAPTGQNAEITDTSDKTTEGAPLPEDPQERKEFRKAIDAVVKELRQAYWTAKESYRIPPERLERVKEALNLYCGTKNFHNFTIRKSATDPSAKRHIKSFVVSGDPIIINGVEWVSLKVHGQSFMMHQIRKMVGLVALVVRCGCPTSRVSEALDKNALNIPKAPGLGLLLERPVFDHYNTKADNFGREKIEFELVEEEMNAFKQKEIYDRIFREEMEGHTFHAFFSHVDNFKQNIFLYLTSKGMEAATVPQGQRRHLAKEEAELVDSDDDEEAPKVGEGAEG